MIKDRGSVWVLWTKRFSECLLSACYSSESGILTFWQTVRTSPLLWTCSFCEHSDPFHVHSWWTVCVCGARPWGTSKRSVKFLLLEDVQRAMWLWTFVSWISVLSGSSWFFRLIWTTEMTVMMLDIHSKNNVNTNIFHKQYNKVNF